MSIKTNGTIYNNEPKQVKENQRNIERYKNIEDTCVNAKNECIEIKDYLDSKYSDIEQDIDNIQEDITGINTQLDDAIDMINTKQQKLYVYDIVLYSNDYNMKISCSVNLPQDNITKLSELTNAINLYYDYINCAIENNGDYYSQLLFDRLKLENGTAYVNGYTLSIVDNDIVINRELSSYVGIGSVIIQSINKKELKITSPSEQVRQLNKNDK